MTSNIEPIAREISRSICRDNEMPETQIDRWVLRQCLRQALWMKRANGSKEKTGAEA
jgi:hypothetical protein